MPLISMRELPTTLASMPAHVTGEKKSQCSATARENGQMDESGRGIVKRDYELFY